MISIWFRPAESINCLMARKFYCIRVNEVFGKRQQTHSVIKTPYDLSNLEWNSKWSAEGTWLITAEDPVSIKRYYFGPPMDNFPDLHTIILYTTYGNNESMKIQSSVSRSMPKGELLRLTFYLNSKIGWKIFQFERS